MTVMHPPAPLLGYKAGIMLELIIIVSFRRA